MFGDLQERNFPNEKLEMCGILFMSTSDLRLGNQFFLFSKNFLKRSFLKKSIF